MSRAIARWLGTLVCSVLASACPTASPNTPDPDSTASAQAIYEWRDPDVARLYPNIEALYAGEHGIYRTCGPNNNVCHNAREYPNLRTLGALIENIDEPCNQNTDRAADVNDWCETRGDFLAIDERNIEVEIGRFEPMEEAAIPRAWRVWLRDSIPMLEGGEWVQVRRAFDSGEDARENFTNFALDMRRDPENSNAILFDLPAPPNDPEEEDWGEEIAEALSTAGEPAMSPIFRVGDPNGNGVFGADLGHRLIKPGAPNESYLMRRLVDPTFGVLMPLANCCSWRKDSLRALWCWIAGLEEDGSNARDAIDYNDCPEGPVENVVYPVLGDMCEASGLCPVLPREVTGPPDWQGVWSIVQQSCAGSDCHVGGDGGEFSIALDGGDAHPQLTMYVVPGDRATSDLYRRLLPDCEEPACVRMPYERPPLTASEIDLIGQWIDNGAPQDQQN